MVTTCGFEEAKENDPHKFEHMRRFNALERYRVRISKSHLHEPVTTFQTQSISRLDFDSLSPGTPVTQGVVDFAFNYLQSVADTSNKKDRVALVGTQATNRLILGDVRELKPLIHTKKFIFLPIECPDGDWSLVVLFIPHGKAFYYNMYPKCRQGLFLVQGIVERAEFVCGKSIELVELNAPHLEDQADLGVVVCEITAMLVRRLIKAKPSHRLSLGLGGTWFIVGAGRTMLQTLILSLFENVQEPGTSMPQALEIYQLKPPRSSSRTHSLEVLAQATPSPCESVTNRPIKSMDEIVNEIWMDAKRHATEELQNENLVETQGWWARCQDGFKSFIK